MQEPGQDKLRSVRRGRLAVVGLIVAAGLAVTAGVVLQDDDGEDEAAEVTATDEPTSFDEPHTFELRVYAEEPAQPANELAFSVGATELHTVAEVADGAHWRVRSGYGPGLDLDEQPVTERRRLGDTTFDRFVTPEVLPIDVPEWQPARFEVRPVERYLGQLRFLEAPPLPEPPVADPPAGVVEPLPAFEPMSINSASLYAEILPLGYLLPAHEDPRNVFRLFDAATDLQVIEELADGGRRVRGLLPPIPEMAEASQFDLPPVEIEMTLDEQGRPLMIAFDLERDGQVVEVDLTFNDWGGPVGIVAPPEDEIDHTPWLSEEVLGIYPGLLVLISTLPDDWSLVSADVGGGLECPMFLAYYSSQDEVERVQVAPDPVEPPMAMMLSAQIAECAEDVGVDSATSDGSTGEEGAIIRSVEVGGLVVEVSGLGVDERTVDAALDSLRPANVEDLEDAMAPWVREL